MSKYIDADLLRKEIEFAKSVYSNPQRVVHGIADAYRQDGRAAMCDDILKKIDSFTGQDIRDAFIAGAEWQKEQMITKAVEWLKSHANDYIVDLTPTYPDADAYIIVGGMCWEDFRKAMED